MTEIVLYFPLGEDASAEPVASEIQTRLDGLEEVDEAEAVVSTERFGVVEASLLVTAAVTLVRSGRSLTDELTALVQSVKRLAAEIRGVTDVFVDVGGERVRVDDLTEEQLRAFA